MCRSRLNQGSSNPPDKNLIRISEVFDGRFAVHSREQQGGQERRGARFESLDRLPRDAFEVCFAKRIEAAQEVGGGSGSPQALQQQMV